MKKTESGKRRLGKKKKRRETLNAHLLTAQELWHHIAFLSRVPLRRCHLILFLFFKKKKKKRGKREKQTWKAVRREARLRSDRRSVVGVSQHTGTGSTGSGSLLLGHYVIRWAQFALLLACAGLRGSPVCECVLGQREVKEARAVHSSRIPPLSSCTPLYINPKVFRLPLFRDIFNSLIQLSSQLLLLPSLCGSLPDCTL